MVYTLVGVTVENSALDKHKVDNDDRIVIFPGVKIRQATWMLNGLERRDPKDALQE